MTTREKEYLILSLVFMLFWCGVELRYCGSESCDTERKTFQYAGNLRAKCSTPSSAVGLNSVCTVDDNTAARSVTKIVTYGSGITNLPNGIVCQGPDPYFSRCSRVRGQHCHWQTLLVCRGIDRTDPELTCPDDMTLFIPPTSNEVQLEFTVNCTDNSREKIKPNCSRPESGDYFSLKDSPETVNCTCTDDSGNQDQCNFTVIVKEQTDPELTCPDDMTLFIPPMSNEVQLEFTVNCTDNSGEKIKPNCSRPKSGAYFSLTDSSETVNCTCTDDSGKQDQCNFTVIVNGDSSSSVVCPPDRALFASANQTTTAVVEWKGLFYCINEDNNEPSCTPKSGSEFDVGETRVTCTCRDNTEDTDESQCSFVITVTVVMYPKLPESLKTKTFHELDSGQNFSLVCTADHAEEFWWKQETFSGTKIISNSSRLHIDSVSFRDQGSYFCIVKGKRDYDTSEAQVLVVKDYLQFVVKLFINNSSPNNVIEDVNKTLMNESFEVIQSECSEEGILNLYIFKKTTKETKASTVHELIETRLNSVWDDLRTFDYEILKTAYCTGEQINTTDGHLTFPDALVGKSVNSSEISLTSRFAARARRKCDGDYINEAAWKEHVLTNVTMDVEENITRSIENLAANLEMQPISSSNASYVADVLENVTASAEIETEHLETVATALTKVVEAKNVSAKVTTSVVLIVDNIVKSTSSNNTAIGLYSNTSASLLETLQQQLNNVRDSGQPFNFTTPNIAVRITHIIYVNTLVVYKTIFADENGEERDVSEAISNDEIEYVTKESGVPTDSENDEDVKVSIQVDSTAVTKSARPLTDGTNSEPLPISFLIHRSTVLFNDEYNDSMRVNTLIVSASVQGNVKELPEESNIVTHFHPIQERRCAKISCVYWDEYEGTGGWSRNGCRSTEGVHRGSSYTCHCNHLTNFAVLLDVEGDINNRFLDYVSIIGCVVSTWCIILTICTYLSIKKLRSSRPQQIVINICLALLGLYLSFLAGIEQVHLEIGCIVFGALIHFFTLASVTWMSVEATNMYLLFVKVFNANIRHFMIKASLVGWGIPAVIVVISAVVSPDSYSNCKYCFPDSDSMIFYISVLGVVGLLITYNIIIFIRVTHKLTCARNKASKANLSKQETFRRLQNVVAISVLLGVTWIFGLLSFGEIRETSNFIFCALNSFQGLCIFVLFCVRQKDIRNAWKTWLLLSFGRIDQRGPISSTNVEGTSKRNLINEAKSTSTMKSNSKVQLSNLKSDISEAPDENPYNLYSEVKETNYEEVKNTNYTCYTDVDPKGRNLPPIPEDGHYTKEINPAIVQHDTHRTTTETPELYMEIAGDHTLTNGRNGHRPSAEEQTDNVEYSHIPLSNSAHDSMDFTENSLVYEDKIQSNYTLDPP